MPYPLFDMWHGICYCPVVLSRPLYQGLYLPSHGPLGKVKVLWHKGRIEPPTCRSTLSGRINYTPGPNLLPIGGGGHLRKQPRHIHVCHPRHMYVRMYMRKCMLSYDVSCPQIKRHYIEPSESRSCKITCLAAPPHIMPMTPGCMCFMTINLHTRSH